MISYAPFFETLKQKDITIYYLITKKGINSNTINRMKKGESITTYTLNHLCEALNCTVADILEYVPDFPYTNTNENKYFDERYEQDS